MKPALGWIGNDNPQIALLKYRVVPLIGTPVHRRPTPDERPRKTDRYHAGAGRPRTRARTRARARPRTITIATSRRGCINPYRIDAAGGRGGVFRPCQGSACNSCPTTRGPSGRAARDSKVCPQGHRSADAPDVCSACWRWCRRSHEAVDQACRHIPTRRPVVPCAESSQRTHTRNGPEAVQSARRCLTYSRQIDRHACFIFPGTEQAFVVLTSRTLPQTTKRIKPTVERTFLVLSNKTHEKTHFQK